MENLKTNDSALSGGDFQGIAGLSSDDSLLAENQRRLSGAAQTQASVITHRGLEVKLLFSTSGRGRYISLDIPLYRTAMSQACAFCSPIVAERALGWVGDFKCNGDVSIVEVATFGQIVDTP
jgi:hypothetical protein